MGIYPELMGEEAKEYQRQIMGEANDPMKCKNIVFNLWNIGPKSPELIARLDDYERRYQEYLERQLADHALKLKEKSE